MYCFLVEKKMCCEEFRLLSVQLNNQSIFSKLLFIGSFIKYYEIYILPNINYLLGDIMDVTTKIYDKFQTVIPSEIRKHYNLDKNYIIKWSINESGKTELDFIKKIPIKDMIGRYHAKEPIDSVELKHKFKNGEL